MNFEQQQYDKDPNDEPDDDGLLDQNYNVTTKHIQDRVLTIFQTAAKSISEVYTLQSHGLSSREAFQGAATGLATLYRENQELDKNLCDTTINFSHEKRNRDILAWVKKQKKHISRSDLISFITGHPITVTCTPKRNLPSEAQDHQSLFGQTKRSYSYSSEDISMESPKKPSQSGQQAKRSFTYSDDITMESPKSKKSRYS